MARGYLTFGDIERKLDVLRVECAKCDRKGRYHVAQGQQVEVDHDSRDSIWVTAFLLRVLKSSVVISQYPLSPGHPLGFSETP